MLEIYQTLATAGQPLPPALLRRIVHTAVTADREDLAEQLLTYQQVDQHQFHQLIALLDGRVADTVTGHWFDDPGKISDPARLLDYVGHPLARVRAGLARLAGLADEAYAQLARDGNVSVLSELAVNPACPPHHRAAAIHAITDSRPGLLCDLVEPGVHDPQLFDDPQLTGPIVALLDQHCPRDVVQLTHCRHLDRNRYQQLVEQLTSLRRPDQGPAQRTIDGEQLVALARAGCSPHADSSTFPQLAAAAAEVPDSRAAGLAAALHARDTVQLAWYADLTDPYQLAAQVTALPADQLTALIDAHPPGSERIAAGPATDALLARADLPASAATALAARTRHRPRDSRSATVLRQRLTRADGHLDADVPLALYADSSAVHLLLEVRGADGATTIGDQLTRRNYPIEVTAAAAQVLATSGHLLDIPLSQLPAVARAMPRHVSSLLDQLPLGPEQLQTVETLAQNYTGTLRQLLRTAELL